MDAKIEEQLRYAIARDKEKGGDGMRTTREVADYTGYSMAKARRLLNAAWDADEIECFDGGASGHMGNPCLWRLKEKT